MSQYSNVFLHIILILVLAWFAKRLAKRAIRLLKSYLNNQAESNPEEIKRIETLGQVFHYVASVIIVVVAGMLLLGELGISIGPLLATAGVVGMAIGFGAQHLIRDYFTGFFILLENQIRQGDVVEVAGKGGLVEEVTLRYIKLRDYEGNVHFIPNGAISTVTNMSRGFAFSVIDVGVAYRENVDEVIEVIKKVDEELRNDPDYASDILEPMEILGLDQFADSALIIKARTKTKPIKQWRVAREFNRRLKIEFDKRDIEIPFPHLTLYMGKDKQDQSPPLNVQIDSNKK